MKVLINFLIFVSIIFPLFFMCTGIHETGHLIMAELLGYQGQIHLFDFHNKIGDLDTYMEYAPNQEDTWFKSLLMDLSGAGLVMIFSIPFFLLKNTRYIGYLIFTNGIASIAQEFYLSLNIVWIIIITAIVSFYPTILALKSFFESECQE